MITILAIESSCDDTSCAIVRDGKVISNFIASQKVHQKFGGVVPELASRAHLQNIVPVVSTALSETRLPEGQSIALQEVDAIAFTQAPGLIGSLLVGAEFAKSLALALDKPLIRVHHMQAHVLANLISDETPSFPFLCLTVSGGHTQIVQVDNPLSFKVLGQTIDDAAGEAFDKSAKLLGLPYPGGPVIDKYAKEGNPEAFHFAEPRVPGLDYSFSGLKTSILYFLQKQTAAFKEENLKDLCASIQASIIRILLKKLRLAVLETGITRFCIAGGVSANTGLREALKDLAKKNQWQAFIPNFEYCTDNAAMVAITAYYKFLDGNFAGLDSVPSARAAWEG